MIIIAVIVGIVLIGGFIAGVITFQQVSNSREQTITNNPTYQTIIPTSKSISWDRISPPGNDPVYAYPDSLDGVAISVSEQPLPQSFKTNTDSQVSQLAKGYNATDTIAVGNDKVYIGTSVKGPQSLIFTKSNLLILIKSQQKIADASWKTYIASLQ
jgi:hypothetical protein